MAPPPTQPLKIEALHQATFGSSLTFQSTYQQALSISLSKEFWYHPRLFIPVLTILFIIFLVLAYWSGTEIKVFHKVLCNSHLPLALFSPDSEHTRILLVSCATFILFPLQMYASWTGLCRSSSLTLESTVKPSFFMLCLPNYPIICSLSHSTSILVCNHFFRPTCEFSVSSDKSAPEGSMMSVLLIRACPTLHVGLGK